MTGALNAFVAADQGSETPAAVISTVGALLGVVLGGFLTAVLEGTRQRRRDERLERAARRLLFEELAEGSDAFLRIAEDNTVRRASVPEPVASWDQYRELLAARMTDRDWRVVTKAVLTARDLCGELGQLTATDVGLAMLPAPLQEELKQAAGTLGNAASLLLPGEGAPGQRRGED